ncbi:hypothetical protein CVT24_012359 [Panaeolus cyanescens]|uniref:Uncharacterized protein n=1 Tax=Panaeolus cyanescens TaxID=181874 RepID=A0A409YYP1_9AGAR|nr:hypothetical protein CVT24_012359 [Panaeolus cyanescens]
MAFRKHSNIRDRNPTPLRSSWSPIDSASATVPASRVELALNNLSKKSLKYEHLMKDLEARLCEDLGNFRRVDSLLQEVNTNLQRTLERSNRSVQTDVPQIKQELHQSMGLLSRLEKDLPETQEKAAALVSDLSWLNTEFYERWRVIIFTSKSPVSWRWKACAYRAHRHRLVWGDKLMS